MKILKGTSAVSGIVEGVICLYNNKPEEKINHYSINSNQVPREINRLNEAFKYAINEMAEMVKVASSKLDKQAKEIFNTHLLILKDEGMYRKCEDLIKSRKINAEHAVGDVFEEYIKRYKSAEGHFKELVHDLVDTRNRIYAAFSSETGRFQCKVGDKQPVIVASDRLTPSMVLQIPHENVLAFLTYEGGFTSHATILARSFGVPMIFGVDVSRDLGCGDHAIIDGSRGKVILSPDKKNLDYYRKKIENLRKKKMLCERIDKDDHAKTRAGSKITLKLNISVPEEFSTIRDFPHDGVGLLRTEFMFIQNETPPSEEEQYKAYKRVLNETDGSVTVRVLDLSNDKLPAYLQDSDEKVYDIVSRGAAAAEIFRDLYISQFKALLRANEKQNMRLLYPMIADVNDLNTYRSILAEAKRILKKEKVKFYDGNLKEGIMIETPAAVMMAEELMKEADFVNIGSNDLLQYTLASPRGSMAAEKRYHMLHPALVKLIELLVKKANKAGKEVCLCGEAASFEEFYPILLNIGLKSFSVTAAKFVDIKCELMHLSGNKNKEALQDYYKTQSKEEMESYFAKYI